MVSNKKNKSSLKPILVLLTLLISTTIYFDIKHHGSWEASKLRHLIKQTGVCEYTHVALEKGKVGLLYVDARIEENIPDYKKKVAEFSDPYVRLAKNLGIIVLNSCVEFKNFVVHKLDVYAPGVVESSQDAVVTVFSSTVMYFNRSVDYLREEVFVGQLSPENMQRVVLEAFNTTQQKATEYYHWLYEKVQTTIK